MAEEKKAQPKTRKYKLTGRSHSGFEDDGITRKEYVTGDMVPLTDAQYESFKDKFVEGDEEGKVNSPTKPESNTDPKNPNIAKAPEAKA